MTDIHRLESRVDELTRTVEGLCSRVEVYDRYLDRSIFRVQELEAENTQLRDQLAAMGARNPGIPYPSDEPACGECPLPVSGGGK